MKRVIVILLIVISAAGISVVGYQYAKPVNEAPSLAEDPSVEIVPVGRDTLLDAVEATGRIEPKAEVDMNFEIGGVVEEVPVERGQNITAGTVLARLNTDNLEFEIIRAEIDLAQQKAELERLFEPELAEKIASARANIDSAKLKLAELLDGPDPDEVAKAEAELSRTQIALKKAQWEYDEVAYRGDIGAMPQADRLQEATLEYEIALADYNLKVKDPTPAEIAEAQSAVASAEATLAELLKEPSAAEIAAKQALVDKSRLTLEQKKRDLEEAVLIAPTDGVLLEVNIEPGERVLNDAAEAAMVIADTSAYLLKVEVDEIDIGQIKPGQEANIRLDAFLEPEFQGVVTDISPRPIKDDANAIVMYEVTVTLDAGDAAQDLLSGMTANATIQTGQLDEVVVVPNRAIQIDRSGSKPTVYVEKLDGDGKPTRVEVELGLRNGSVTEVVAGLEDGDQVVIRTTPEAESTPNL
jgi:HlyD family secretion protein